MAPVTLDDAPAPPAPEPAPAPAPKKRRVVWRVLIGLGLVIVLVVAAVALWFFVLRSGAGERSTEDALKDLRASGASGATDDGRPAVGVYTALASGSEDIGLPGLTESFGPNAPVTVTHADGGCFVYRVDLNTNHFRTWTFCPTEGATFALTASDGSTRRNVPGLTTPTVTRYVCEQPIPYLWPDPVVGDQRSGSCTGTSDAMDGVTGDTCVVEVLDIGVMTVGDEDVPVVHVRSTDTFSGNQGGTEVDEWWLDSRTGLPVRLEIDADVTSSVVDYRESGTVELTSLVPAT
jgi:hypothetical protein